MATVVRVSAQQIPASQSAGSENAARVDNAFRPRLVIQSGHKDRVVALAIAHRAQIAASLDRNEVKLFDLQTGREFRMLRAMQNVSSMALQADGLQLATADRRGGGIQLWNPISGALQRSIAGSYDVFALAYTPDGGTLIAAADSGFCCVNQRHFLLVYDSTGAELRRIAVPHHMYAIDVHPSGRWLAAGGWSDTVLVWDLHTESSTPAAKLAAHSGRTARLRFSPGGMWLATAGADSAIHIWKTDGWRSERILRGAYALEEPYDPPIAFTPDGTQIMEAREGRSQNVGMIRSWKIDSGTVAFDALDSRTSRVEEIEIVGNIFMTASDNNVTIRNLAEQQSFSISNPAQWVEKVLVSSDGGTLATLQGGLHLWDLENGRLRMTVPDLFSLETVLIDSARNRILSGQGYAVSAIDGTTGALIWESRIVRGGYNTGASSIALHPSGRWVFANGGDRDIRILDASTGAIVSTFTAVPKDMLVRWLALSPDGSHLAVNSFSEDNDARHPVVMFTLAEKGGQMTAARETEFGHYDKLSQSGENGAFSPDGRHFVGYNEFEPDGAFIWTLQGESVRPLAGADAPFVYSPDGRVIASRLGFDGDIGIWDAETGVQLQRLQGHTDVLETLSFTPDGRHLLSGARDFTTRVWRLETGQELAQLTTFADGTWIVADKQGRFDTNNLEAMPFIHWVMPDAPTRPLPLEIFMRDYYEPRLLARHMANEQMPSIRTFTQLERLQPVIRIDRITMERGDSTARIRLTITGTRDTSSSAAAIARQSGAYDLHVFRNSQLVALRKGDLLVDADSTTVVLEGVRLPRGATRPDSLAVTAYAFNRDRVKSSTARAAVRLPRAIESREGRAYVISLGVDSFSDPAWNLRFAANDAVVFQSTIGAKLRALDDYSEVVLVPLIASTDPGISTDASKAVFRGVLDILAGRSVASAIRALIPNVEQLLAATPEDLVLISLSTHGYTDKQGVFYLLPQDLGPSHAEGRVITPQLLERAISSDELSEWMLTIDAGEIVMIVDACHSAAAVEGDGFKAGPMGSRGLGQLAFNKGMRILAASQAEDVALESGTLRHGLLTYALVQEGITAGLADHLPRDGQLHIEEWLRFGEKRVPGMYRELRAGTLSGGRGLGNNAKKGELGLQQPTLFDFGRKDGSVLLAR